MENNIFMKKYKLPNNINLKFYKNKNNLYIFKINNDKTMIWFSSNSINEFKIINRIVSADKLTINYIKKAVKSLLLGYKRSLFLHGVGYKATISNQNLLIKVSNTQPNKFLIPNDMAIDIRQNIVHCWSYNINIIDEFFKKIILNTPAPKNYITWK